MQVVFIYIFIFSSIPINKVNFILYPIFLHNYSKIFINSSTAFINFSALLYFEYISLYFLVYSFLLYYSLFSEYFKYFFHYFVILCEFTSAHYVNSRFCFPKAQKKTYLFQDKSFVYFFCILYIV